VLKRDSHKPFLIPNQEFERQFGGETVLAGLRLKKAVKFTFKAQYLFLIYFHLFSVDHIS
jgi:hypothetical protein